MRFNLRTASFVSVLVAVVPCAHIALADGAADWAFADTAKPEMNALAPDDGKIRHVQGSKVELSIPQIRNFYAPPDWFPVDHPAMPALVAQGVNPGVFACGYCHLPTGNGRPENANLAGLPANYIVAQLKEMASGARTSSLPKHFPQELMLKLAKPAAENAGLAEAAAYFSSMKPKAVFKVVEGETIPKVEVYRWIYRKAAAEGTEPIGARVVEVPDDFEAFENRDGHTTYTAFVPPGSIAKGEALVKSGKCADCHGADLKGLLEKNAPPIAGRSPGYLARQLFDFRSGARNGAGAANMKPVAAALTDDDLIAVTAYLATLAP